MRRFAPTFDTMEQRQLLSTGLIQPVKGSASVSTLGSFVLTASTVSPSSINLSWTISSPNMNCYAYMSSDGCKTFSSLGNLKGTSYTVNNLSPNTTYNFFLVAYSGRSTLWSNHTSATTAPFTLNATSNGPNSINLSWGPFKQDALYYVYMTSNHWASSTTLGNTTDTSYVVNNLSPNTTYSFVLLAYNKNNFADTAWTNEASAKTALQSIHTVHPSFDPSFHYAVGPDSLWSVAPSWQDVHQGGIGDCWLEATISQVGQRNPDFVKNMFTDLGYFDEDGVTVHCWNVRLYDKNLQPHEILVDNEFPINDQGSWGANGHYSGQIWASLIEKAYAIAAQSGYVRSFGTPHNSYYDVTYGTPMWALKAITGHEPIDNIFTKKTDTDIAGVEYYYSNNYYVCLETVGTWDSRIVANHSYSLESVDSGVYTVNNPWGSLLAIDGATLSKNFSDYDVCMF